MLRPVVFLVSLGAWAIRALVLSRSELLFENVALLQQVCALKRERPRPPLDDVDRAFWVALRASWSGWARRLIIVDPDTVAKWHRERFRRHWGYTHDVIEKSLPRVPQKKLMAEINLIRR